jgi:lipoprotein-anchoring transpeptidase ErfK/SrfK
MISSTQKVVLLLLISFGAIFFLFFKKDTPSITAIPSEDLVASTSPLGTEDPQYRSFKTTSVNPGAELAQEIGFEHVPLVISFNRFDPKHIPQGAIFSIPKELNDWEALSPFPKELPVAKDVAKLLLVSQRIQAFAVYESGSLVRWGVVSTGKASTPTPSKLYFTNWKGKLVVSSIKDEWVMPWYFNLDNLEGVSLHQYDLPGRPASHSCIRLSETDAKWIYDWADQWVLNTDGQTQKASGTPVIIFGEYAYGKTAPWKMLPEDPLATTLSEKELSDIITPELPTILTKAKERQEVQTLQN